MPHVPAVLQKQLESAAPPEVELRFKPMFGGIGGYADGHMFASLSDVGLALKLGEADRDALLKIKGAKPLQYASDAPPSKSYVVVPEAMLSDRRALQSWIAKSAAFVKTAIKKKPAARKAGRGIASR